MLLDYLSIEPVVYLVLEVRSSVGNVLGTRSEFYLSRTALESWQTRQVALPVRSGSERFARSSISGAQELHSRPIARSQHQTKF